MLTVFKRINDSRTSASIWQIRFTTARIHVQIQKRYGVHLTERPTFLFRDVSPYPRSLRLLFLIPFPTRQPFVGGCAAKCSYAAAVQQCGEENTSTVNGNACDVDNGNMERKEKKKRKRKEQKRKKEEGSKASQRRAPFSHSRLTVLASLSKIRLPCVF